MIEDYKWQQLLSAPVELGSWTDGYLAGTDRNV